MTDLAARMARLDFSSNRQKLWSCWTSKESLPAL